MKSPAYFDILPENLQKRILERRQELREVTSALQRADGWTLEFGCGHGHYLAAYAKAFPNKFCVGIDMIAGRIERANRKAASGRLPNLHFIRAEAGEFLGELPDGLHLNEVFMLFPDPWPKLRHHKNRMIQHEFLDQVARKMRPGSPFHFRTDHPELFEWAKRHFATNPHWSLSETCSWPFEHPTLFQNLMASWHSLSASRTATALSPAFYLEGASRVEGEQPRGTLTVESKFEQAP